VLEAAGRICDGWNGWGSTPEDFAADAAVVRAAAGSRHVEGSWAGLVVLADSKADAEARLGGRDPSEYLVGGPEEVGEHLRAMAAAGAEHLIVTFPDGDRSGNYERLGGIDLGGDDS
jgi:alkanesulfonate monooxygenase SsuD/methylene tetrahydromethanopterin reductase-like flavin-dependent oxidoreductase (luciferase family)